MPRPTPRPFRPRVVRYYAGGKRCVSDAAGAERRVETAETWYARLGKEKISLKTTDEGQAWERLRALLRRRVERKAGLRDSFSDAAELPLASHLDAWLAVLAARGVGEDQQQRLRSHVERVAAEAGWAMVTALTLESCLLAADRIAQRDGLGSTARNHLLAHAKQFSRWLRLSGRLATHPLEGLRARSTEADVRHERRCPEDGEVARLMDHLHSPTAKVLRGMTGPQRAIAYKVAMACGLRAGELSSLEKSSIDLDGATLTVRAAYDKRRRRVTLPLPGWLVAELRKAFGTGALCKTGSLFPFPRKKPGEVLQADLAAAGVAKSIPGPHGNPLFFDFHSLRVWYCTRLAEQPGIDIKTLMELCRHSDPRLTLRVYARANEQRKTAAIEALPEPGKGQPAADRATGAGQPAPSVAPDSKNPA